MRQTYEQILNQPVAQTALESAQPTDTTTPFVARVDEWTQLQEGWQRTHQGGHRS